MKLKFFILGLIFLITCFTSAQESWNWLYPPIPSNKLFSADRVDSTNVLIVGDAGLMVSLNTALQVIDYSYLQSSQNIKDVQLIDNQKGWLITSDEYPYNEGGKLFQTIDGGLNWFDLYNFNQPLSDLCVIDSLNLFILDWNGTLLKSSNDGQSWTQQTFNGTAEKIVFISDSTGFIVGYFNNRFYKTTDKGDNWQEISNSQFYLALYDIKFYNKMHGFIVGESGYFYETTDGGDTWTRRLITAGMYNLYSILLFDSQKIVLIGRIESSYSEESVILLSQNSGLDWVELGVFDYNVNSLIKVSENEFLTIGDKGIIYSYKLSDSSWIRLDQGIKENIVSTSFLNSQIGWGLSEQGKVLKTVDSGNSWSMVFENLQPQDKFFDIFFSDANNGWITSVSNHYLNAFFTTDGGTNWVQSTLDDYGEFKAIYFISPEIGWIARDHEHILKTTNRGSTWQEQGVTINYYDNPSIEDIQFINENIGYAAGGYVSGIDPYGMPINNTLVIKTTNGGTNWEAIFNEEGNYIVSLSFVNSQVGYISKESALLKTIDGGESFVVKPLPLHDLFNKVSFINENDGWIAGWKGKIYRTTDAGDTWIPQKVLTRNNINDICFINDTLGWFVGNNGTIFRFGTSSTNNIINYNDVIAEYSLQQNYPNPFNPTTTIKYSIPTGNNFVSLKVYDILGNEVATLINEGKPAGEYKVNFNASKLASGIYFYQLKAGTFVRTKKMILLK